MGKYILAIAMFAFGVAVGHAMKGQGSVTTSVRLEQVSPFEMMKSAKNLPVEATADPF